MNYVKILKIISDFLHVSAFARMDYTRYSLWTPELNFRLKSVGVLSALLAN